MKTALPVRPPLPSLPQEVILHITQYLQEPFSETEARTWDPQRSLWAASLLSRDWYGGTIEALYRHPRLTSKNYDEFVRTVCPSINTHVKKTDLAGMVRMLDLSQLVFAGTKSFVARLLRRVKDNLEVLNAPQTSFAVNSLAALSKCDHLRVLDLSLVTEQIPILDFFRAIQNLSALRSLYLPRSSLLAPKTGPGTRASAWPPNLTHVILPGRISRILSAYAPEQLLSIESLHLQEVPLDYWDMALMNRIEPLALKRLTIREPMSRSTRFDQAVWDMILMRFAGLKSLRLEYFSSLFHLMNAFDVEKGEDLPAGLESLEELTIGPVAVQGIELLRGMNRPFELVADDPDAVDQSPLSFFAELPKLRRLILMLSSAPFRSLGDLHAEYLSFSQLLQEREESIRADAEASGNEYTPQLAGVYWSLRGPATDLTEPSKSELTAYRIDEDPTR